MLIWFRFKLADLKKDARSFDHCLLKESNFLQDINSMCCVQQHWVVNYKNCYF